MIELFHPYIPKKAVEDVADVLRTRWIGQGPKVDQFEKAFAAKFNVASPVAVNSGTGALETAYEIIGIKPGDEVITTPLTCTATNLPLLRMGAKLVWADIDPTTLCIDPEDVSRKITDRTKAIVIVHLGGIEAQIGNWVKDDQGVPGHIPVVADAAQALGIFTGDFTCCSFQAIKHITTGDGGMFVPLRGDNAAVAHEAKLRRWFGIDREKKIANNWQAYRERAMTFDIELPGTKRHMNDIAAAMGLVGLEHYDAVLRHRSELASRYLGSLDGVAGLRFVGGNHNNVWWLFTLLVERRDDFARVMFEAGIDTNMVQIRNDAYKVFGGRADLPNMDAVEGKYICLPLGMHVSLDDVDYICDTIKRGW